MDMELQETLELLKKIPPSKFDLLAKQHGLNATQEARVRSVLVDGISVREVAERDNVSEEAIRRVLRKLLGSLYEPTRLSLAHFDMAVQQMPRFSRRNRELARRILVEGESRVRVAEEAEISLSTLDKVLVRVRRLAIPDGWRVITVALPEDCAEGVERMSEEAYKDYLEQKED